MSVLKVKRLSDTARLPERAHIGDAGYDLFSDEGCAIEPGMRRRIKTGIAIELPPESEGQIRSRSGLADQYGVVVFNSPGTVDEGFRGEIEVILANFGDASFHVQKGIKIAQLVIASVQYLEVHEVELLTGTQRSKSGFGSSGK